MIRRAGALAIPRAINLPHPPGPSSDHLLGPLHGHRLARAHSGERRRFVATEPGDGRRAALHLRRAGAEAGLGAAATITRPAAVAGGAVGAGGLGAALDVGGVGGASARDGYAARGGAGGGCEADAWWEGGLVWVEGVKRGGREKGGTCSAAGADAGLVDGCHDGCGCEEDEGVEMHGDG